MRKPPEPGGAIAAGLQPGCDCPRRAGVVVVVLVLRGAIMEGGLAGICRGVITQFVEAR